MNDYYLPIFTKEIELPYYVKCVGCQKNQNHINREKGYPASQWIQCEKGKGRLLINSEEFIISSKMGFYIPANMKHEYYGIEEPWETHFIAFTGFGRDLLLEKLGLDTYGVFHIKNYKLLDNLIKDIYNISKNSSIEAAMKSSVLTYQLLLELKRNISNYEILKNNRQIEMIEKVISYMDQNYTKVITIEELGKCVNVSSQYLCKVFNDIVGMRPFEYLNYLRIQKSKELLLNFPQITTGEIAEKVGYQSHSYFGVIFKKYEGITPMRYRNLFKY